MSLSSVFSTALSGMAASETMIDVAGNNVANANTVGFKASDVEFATQFSQTLSVGTAPEDGGGGSDPTQTGLGVEVASVTPDFSQGTLQTTSNPSDLAIQGNGFFAVQSSSGQQLYTRNGQFSLNSNNQLTDSSGDLVMGFGVDSNFNIQSTQLQPLSIPLGLTSVAHATQNVTMVGTLSASGTPATTAQISQTGDLGDASYSAPASGATAAVADTPSTTSITTASSTGTGGLSSSAQYQYEFVFEDANGTTQSTPSAPVTVTTGASDNTVTLSGLPTDSNYQSLQIYRTDAGGSTFQLVATVPSGTTSYTDTTSDTTLNAGTSPPLDTTELTGDYSYYVTFSSVAAGNNDANGNPLGGIQSRPSAVIGPVDVVNGRVQLNNLPLPDGTQWQSVDIYRNTASDPTNFQLVGEVPYNAADPSQSLSFTDNVSDAVLQGTAAGMTAPRVSLNMTGPPATSSTLLTNLLQNNGSSSQSLFQTGTLTFTGEKGQDTLTAQTLNITSTTTVQDLLNFIDQATGIQQNNASTAANPIPNDSSGEPPGATINADGQINIVSNNGTDLAVTMDPSAFQLTTSNGTTTPINLNFNVTQQAVGTGAIANLVVYDSLGDAINVRVTAEMQSQTSSETTYRWYADSPDNEPGGGGANIAVGTGLISFDGEGNFIGATSDTVSVDRSDSPATSPLNFQLNFSALSGLSATSSTLSDSSQDGFPPGQLTSYTITGNGTIQGVFNNGTQRTLGQVQLASFANPDGLVQEGQNLFAAGVNSGLPVIAAPSTEGVGSIVSGAVELSNTDISQSLITLISASTMYRGNSEVISTANQLWDTLLNLQQAG